MIKKIKLKEIRQGDIIAFADDYCFLHFSKVVNISKEIIIRSKLGRLNIYEHKLKDTPIECGNRFIIFRRKNKTLTNRKKYVIL
jgi:hypothetical protein